VALDSTEGVGLIDAALIASGDDYHDQVGRVGQSQLQVTR